MSPAHTPTFGVIAYEHGFEAWTAGISALGDFWEGAIARGATPLELAVDGARWWQTMLTRRPPTWSTPHEIVLETPVARLRDFSPPRARARHLVPTLVLPPQAGHDSCIVDFSDTQSQIQTIRQAGLEHVLALDWIGATPLTRDATVEDYVQAIDRAVEYAGGGAVNLIGDCQGGWLATIYAALRPEQVNTLTLAGAPVDFHAGEPLIGAVMGQLAPGGDLSFYRALVAANGGVLDGRQMLGGFIAINLHSEVAKQTQLLAHLSDAEYLERYREFEDWFKHTQDIPGAFYLWIVERLFRDNALIAGDLEVGGEPVRLDQITCPLNLLAGEADHITPPPQVFAAADYVATPTPKVACRVAPGGHLGLFMGSEALRHHWPPLLAKVLSRSRRRARRAA